MANTFAPPSPPIVAAQLEWSNPTTPVIPSPSQSFAPVTPLPGQVTYAAVPL